MIFTKHLTAAATLAFVAGSTIAQTADKPTHKQSVSAAVTALKSLDDFENSVTEQLAKTRAILNDPHRNACLARLEELWPIQPMSDVADSVRELQAMERELNKQITRLARIRLAIEAHLRDPLLAVLDAVAGATPSSNAKDRHAAHERALTKLRDSMTKQENLRPYLGIVDYYIGQARYEQAKGYAKRRQNEQGAKLYRNAIKSFKEAADDSRGDVAFADVGTSLRATAIYHLTIIHAALGLSSAVNKPQRRANKIEANRWFELLEQNYPKARLRDGDSAAQSARNEISKMSR
jgi:hypothetical protein